MQTGRLAKSFALGALAIGLVTWVALEGGDVGELRTRSPEGGWRTTRVWWAEHDGALWVEAATQERPWLVDLQVDSRVELDRGASTTAWRAIPVPGQEAHDRVRALLREKYGWADAWIGLVQDTSRSIPIRLDRTPELEQR
ncbi:MAG: hypothetical protein DCC71_25230 [Proteobacteria bacterium]|nr:MAG: hypothetical protein DCC71_25230 [Pseudomonadota bacterium]